MKRALRWARLGFARGEVPVGAVLVSQNKWIASAYNRVESKCDPTAHAELLVLQKGAKKMRNWRLTKMTLYTTLEPCTMCAGALLSARIERVVWAAPDLRQGADGSWVDILKVSHPIHPRIQVDRGLYAKEAAHLLTYFFREKRKKER